MSTERDPSPWRCRPNPSSSAEDRHVQLRLSIGPSDTLIADSSSAGHQYGEAQECGVNNRFWNQAFRMGLADPKSGDLTGNGRFNVPVPKVPAKRPFNDNGVAADPLVSGSNSVSLSNWREHSLKEEATNSANPVAGKPSSMTENNRRINSNCSAGQNHPVVGWPPVRSYRKQAVKSAPKPSADADGHCGSSVNADIPPAQPNPKPKPKSNTGLFVKARLEGIKICRKVDLKSHESYDALKLALQDLFQPFLNDNYGKLDLVHGTEYVVTHEDENGECFLVGDEPWHIFIASTVKGLRIMKATDATTIGEKAKSTT